MYIAFGIVGAALFVILILTLVSYLKYHRSLMATLCEFYLKVSHPKRSDEWVINDIKNLAGRNFKKEEKILKKKFKTHCLKGKFQDMNYLVFNENTNKDFAIIYLHGAGYVRPPRKQHIDFVEKLARVGNCTIYFPMYPKAPTTTCEKAFPDNG